MEKRVLLTENIEKDGIEYLEKMGYEVKVARGTSEDILVEEVRDCDAMLVRMANITAKVIQAGCKLKVISKFGVGVDNIDVEEATKQGIQVTNSAESNNNTVAEYTIGLILALSKKFFLYDHELRKGNFGIRNSLGIDLKEKVIGIIGAGSIGKLVAKKAVLGFGMKVIELKRHKDFEPEDGIKYTYDIEYLLKNSDFVSLHVPLTEETSKLIGEKEISIMKPEAFLINTARGGVVDNEALVNALLNNKIAGAAVDVYEGEIPSKDNPLFKLDNVIVTPHTAAHTIEGMQRMSVHPAIGIHEVLSGKKPSWPVNNVEEMKK